MPIGEFIKHTRKAIGITQKELALRAGISYQQLSQYERGVRSPGPNTLEKIVAGMDFDLTEFMLLYYSKISNSCDNDKHPFSADQQEALNDDLAALRKLMNSKGYDLNVSHGRYYLSGQNGVYQLTEDDIQGLLNGAVQYIESLCVMLESKYAFFHIPTKKP